MEGKRPTFDRESWEGAELRAKIETFSLLVTATDCILQGDVEKPITVNELNEILRLANNFDGKRGMHRIKAERFMGNDQGKTFSPVLAKWVEGKTIGIRILAFFDKPQPDGQDVHHIEEWKFELEGP